jgi:hypothetical protein
VTIIHGESFVECVVVVGGLAEVEVTLESTKYICIEMANFVIDVIKESCLKRVKAVLIDEVWPIIDS